MTLSSNAYANRGAVALPLLLVALTLAACSTAPRQPARNSVSSKVPTPSLASSSASSTAAPTDRVEADRRFKLALQLMREHKQAEAQAALVSLSKDFPAFSGPLTALGILYAQGKQRTQALDSFAKASTANPDNAVALNWLGSLYRESGEFKRAEEAYQKAIKAKPDYAPAQLNLGILYDVSLRQPQNALTAYREYQRIAGPKNQNLMVSVWINELEDSTATRTASASTESAR
ncbi:tetratricopeptide repeat protein [Hydrocarboniphaga effusa]|jgi:tetratricopeptide (TPR) repeat protein|uniref:tetratricopeptide repeat protein n=1 Tax=Hydrocarboniphaga effusa TaxID=243629 RepID=UPI00398BE536